MTTSSPVGEDQVKRDKVTHYLWLDFETLDSRRPATVVEFAFIITDRKYNHVDEACGLIAIPLDYNTFSIKPVVRDMHEKSGLWRHLVSNNIPKFTVKQADNLTASIIDQAKHDWLEDHPDEPFRIRIAGSGVSHFDSTIVKDQFPRIWDWMDGFEDSEYLKPTLDFGVLRRFINTLPSETRQALTVKDFEGFVPHRARHDVIAAIRATKALSERLEDIVYRARMWEDLDLERKISRRD